MAKAIVIIHDDQLTPPADVILGSQLADLPCTAFVHVYTQPPFEDCNEIMIIREPGSQPEHLTSDVSLLMNACPSMVCLCMCLCTKL